MVSALEVRGVVAYCRACARARAREVATERETRHLGKASTVDFRCGRGTHGACLAGELAFASATGLPVDFRPRNGDGRADFHTLLGTVDVKTDLSRHPAIYGKPNAITAEIYVLAHAPKGRSARLVGWCWDTQLKAAPIRITKGEKRRHVLPLSQLRPVAWLVEHVRLEQPGIVMEDEITW